MGFMQNSVIKKLKEIHFGAQILVIAVPWEEELIHSPPVPTQAKGSVNSKLCSLLYYLALLFYLA